MGDAASIGKSSTLRKWLSEFASSVIKGLRTVYMPSKPFAPAEMQAIKDQFASRRGITEVALAVDGSHTPFHPTVAEDALNYKNYKGWTSILSKERRRIVMRLTCYRRGYW